MIEELWPLLLQAAAARQRRHPATPPPRGPAWSAGNDWSLAGDWDEASRELFALFKPLLDAPRQGPAWVVAQLGQSLDGCVATRTGDSTFINGADSLVHLHRLRALCDAVIVGAGTVAVDDPQLTTRRVSGPHPTRVLLDPSLRLAGQARSARVFRDGLAPTLWLCDARWQHDAAALVGADRVLAVDGLLRDDATPHLAHAVAALQARGFRRLFVEGGGVTVSRFFAQRCLHRLHLMVAPVLIGDGRPGLQFAGAARLADCPRPHCSVYRMGTDQLWDLALQPAT